VRIVGKIEILFRAGKTASLKKVNSELSAGEFILESKKGGWGSGFFCRLKFLCT
jgi:hypothetical protein